MTGAEMVVKTLEKNGVKVVFGYPGAANCPIIDKLSFSSIKHILTRNEQGAAHMASGYARVTKQAGVCTATSGPGATNLITGIATAYMDSIPMVALTGQVATKLIGKDAFQEVDITGATLPFTKHSYLIKDGLDIPRVVNEAFHIANTGRPGPVLIDFPMDLLKKEFDYPEEDEDVNIRGYKLMGKANESQVKKVAEAIKGAKKPVILAGGGVVISDATNEFRKFVKETDIPVVSTMMGIGILPSDNPRYYGMIGSHGVKRANLLFNRADLVIVMGSRLGDRTVANVKGLEEGNKLIHIDLDPAEIGKNTQPYIPVVGANGYNGLIDKTIKNTRYMLWYHSTLKAEHYYSSPYYEWPVIWMPLLDANDAISATKVSAVSCMGNPAIWWAGIPCVLITFIQWIARRDGKAGFLTIGYLAQYLPWVILGLSGGRITFIYHYFPAILFTILMMGYVIHLLLTKFPKSKIAITVYLVIAIACFFVFYPVVSGFPVSREYGMHLRLLKDWILVL